MKRCFNCDHFVPKDVSTDGIDSCCHPTNRNKVIHLQNDHGYCTRWCNIFRLLEKNSDLFEKPVNA